MNSLKRSLIYNQKICVAVLLFLDNSGLELSGFVLISLLCFYSGCIQSSHSTAIVFYYIGVLVCGIPVSKLLGNPLLWSSRQRFEESLEAYSNFKKYMAKKKKPKNDFEYERIRAKIRQHLDLRYQSLFFGFAGIISLLWAILGLSLFLIFFSFFGVMFIYSLVRLMILSKKISYSKGIFLEKFKEYSDDIFFL